MSYLNLLLPLRARRQLLLETKHFLCRCPRCTRPPPIDALLGGVCCAKCGERGMLLSPDDDGGEATAALLLEGLGLGDEKEEEKEEGEGKGKWRCPVCMAKFTEADVASYLDTVEASKLQVGVCVCGGVCGCVCVRVCVWMCV